MKLCSDLFNSLIVDWNGDVTFCCRDNDMNLKLGNVKEQTLKQINEGKRANEIRLAHIEGRKHEIFPCSECPGNGEAKRELVIAFLKRIQREDLLKAYLERISEK